MRVIQKCQYADNEEPKQTEKKQSLDKHLKPISMHSVQCILHYLNILGQTKQFSVQISEFVHISEEVINC